MSNTCFKFQEMLSYFGLEGPLPLSFFIEFEDERQIVIQLDDLTNPWSTNLILQASGISYANLEGCLFLSKFIIKFLKSSIFKPNSFLNFR